LAAGLSLLAADLHPVRLRIGARWLLSFLGLLPLPIGEVAELHEIQAWPDSL
jgi:hypothetical protein